MTLNEMISSLVSSNYDILLTLRQAKVLAMGIGNKDLVDWINAELNGYSEEVVLPEYRTLGVAVQATISNGVYTHLNQQLSILSLPEEIQKKLKYREFVGGIGDLMELSLSGKEYITYGIDPAIYPYLSDLISHEGLYEITAVYNNVQISRIKGILHHVGNNLLDFLLELKQIIDPEQQIVTIQKIEDKKTNDSIHTLVQQNIYGNVTITGVNQVGSTGDNTINYNEKLKELGVHDEDIKALKVVANITDIEEKERQKKGWIKKVGKYLPVITTSVDFIDTVIEALI